MNIEGIKEMLRQTNDKEIFNLTAQIYKTALDAFIKEGFTREEAFKLIVTIKVGQ
jgi:hypothetical protein